MHANHNTIVTSDIISYDSLIALMEGRLDAIRVEDFYPKKLCSEIANRLTRSDLYGSYKNVPSIGRIGQAYYEGDEDTALMQLYFSHALQWVSQMRNMCSPYLSPLDKLRLLLDDIWPHGATLGRLDGKKMFAGLARVFETHTAGEAHQDIISWHVPADSSGQKITRQLSMNVYLKMPKQGGELMLWRLSMNKKDYFSNLNTNSYGIDPTRIPPADFVVSPNEGELIIINTHRLHGVGKNNGGKRVAWSCFIGFSGEDKPLMFWS